MFGMFCQQSESHLFFNCMFMHRNKIVNFEFRMLFLFIRLLPQSPLWLTFEGKMLSAENLIENLARSNGKTSFPPSFRLHLRNLYNTVKACSSSYVTRHRLLPKFSSPCLRWYFLVHFYLFFVIGLTSDVTESHVMRLNENKYADHFYRGLIDLGVVIFVYYFATR